MASEVQSKCLCCGEIFTVDARNRGRQKYCVKAPCRAAGKAARQRRWREKPENQDYFCGSEHVDRVRRWRATHPGYWRSHRRRGRMALQDALVVQDIEKNENLEDLSARALQDALQAQGPVLIGLIAQLTDSTLQDAMPNSAWRLVTQSPVMSRFSPSNQWLGLVSSLVTLKSLISQPDHEVAPVSSLVTVPRLRPVFANIRGFAPAMPVRAPRAARRGSIRRCRIFPASVAGSIACSPPGTPARNSIFAAGAGAGRG